MKTMELLSPAGDPERLEAALAYGANAVYLGGEAYGMRAGSKNFTIPQLEAAVRLAHSRGVKVYLTCNTLPRNEELPALPGFLRSAAAAGVDAFIIADMGVLAIAKQAAPEVEAHISTQAGIVNWAAAEAFYGLGASRVVLARELSLSDIRKIRDHTPRELELEVFVHGAMCMSFSGRCLLSDYLVGRDANRGDCAQPCRWKYHLMEETRPGQFFPVVQGGNGAYILNSKDLCMIEHIAALAAAGVDSLKIEGRNKSTYYTAITTYAYRNALDGYLKNPTPEYRPDDWVLQEMEKVSHREYTTGFFFGPVREGQETKTAGYIRNWDIAAMVLGQKNNRLTVSQRNRFYEGDVLEAVTPGQKPFSVLVAGLRNAAGEAVNAANQAAATVSFTCQRPVPEGTILRRKREKTEE